ncbi:hypothetical protein [Mesobacillus subterraneus]|uniref:Uncharacterized protein n=1 Tax=Mesobacillus subterraneus TaxID=285983 RepID=A0A427TWL6_9BACI|nr:hypothetical protein [Mesobacillus subterraneus]RSD28831.1 hypothetical protein EJA10_04470 [Mesobacillus subterraneus]
MKKGKWINISLYSLFFLGLSITMFIIYMDIDTSIAFMFVMGFVIFMLLFVLYQVILVMLNLRRLPRIAIGRRIMKFLGAFVLFMAVNRLADYFYRPEALDQWDFGAPLGLAFAIAFFDLIFNPKMNQ